MGKFMSIYICFLCGLMALFFPPFIAGMIHTSLSSGHIDTAVIDAVVFLLFYPLLVASTVTAVQSTSRMFFR